ncbi:HAMP domain-containing histidine kinase [Faecalicatena sp. Marseille-Q4148]|nr:HAMP domain-containing histidine kinase [Faecalicatena sp. Marseille-Q4148]
MSGMSKIRKFKWYMIPLIALILLNAAVITKEYFSYKDETLRLGSILAEKQQSEMTLEEAETVLEKYGYIKDNASSTYREFIKSTIFMLVSSSVVYLVIAVSLKRQEKEIENKYNYVIEDIERTLNALKDGSYNPSESEFRNLAGSECHLSIARLETLIDSLYSSISVVKEKAENDKRETKDVVTDISHQLKTPLAAIKSTYELMENGKLSSDERKELETLMGFQIAALEKLILSLVNISRLESGMIDIKLTEGNLFDSVLEAVNSIWLKADEKNISIDFDDCGEDKLPTIMCDKKWLSEAFVNILDNAIKYSDENMNISIHIMKLNAMVRIEFKDQGSGISDEEKHSIFKRFYRGNNSSSVEGSGVGLYLARRIISEHNGTIMVKDNVVDGKKKGSIFVVHLPIIQ